MNSAATGKNLEDAFPFQSPLFDGKKAEKRIFPFAVSPKKCYNSSDTEEEDHDKSRCETRRL